MNKKYFHKTTNSSHLLILLGLAAFLLLFSLGYLLLKPYIHKRSDYIKQTIELPPIDEEGEFNHTEESEEESGWKNITTQSGDTLGKLFNQSGLSQQVLQAVLKNNPHAKQLTTLKPTQQLQFFIRDNILEKIIFPINTTELLVVSRQHDGQYITKIKARAMDEHEEYLTATVRGSLYATAQRQKIPVKLIQQMLSLFTWEIDFSKEIQSGDQFSILYKAYYVDDTLVRTGEILAVSYRSHDKLHQAIRYVNEHGDVDYYTPQGNSMKKAFSRYPIRFSHISSTYSRARYHPVLKYSRPHKGVDLAAPIGTPIFATGDGRVQTIGHHNGYGNMIKINHSKMYASIYGHMLRFAKGLSKGDYVKRGQVIGYVGQSGLATGPHCHYEFHINQQPKNPTTVKLPRAAPISGHQMASFHMKANKMLASLKLFEAGSLAEAGKKQVT